MPKPDIRANKQANGKIGPNVSESSRESEPEAVFELDVGGGFAGGSEFEAVGDEGLPASADDGGSEHHFFIIQVEDVFLECKDS